MKLTKNKIFFGILIFGLIVNLLVIFDIQYLYLRAIFSFIFLTTVPGLLIKLMLKVRKIGFWEYFVYSIGLSITFLIFGGLFINSTLPLVGIDKPLSLVSLLVSFDIFLLIFTFIAYKRNSDLNYKPKLPKLDTLNRIFFITPLIFLVLSISGAIILNNNGPNILTMIMLGGIAIYVFLIAFLRNKLNEHVFPWTILMMSISLLLMCSLRSWHISGFDIHQEYQMFQLTKENFHWSMLNSPGNAYNACLSITILPTIFYSFLNINSEYIFKLVFQIVFSFVPVTVFLFLRRYTKGIIAFLASFFFISQWEFIQGMPALARQEIVFLFFTSSLLILFNKNINLIFRKTLFLIFGFSMIVSHYSTTYVALALFVSTYFIGLIFRKTENKKPFLKIYEKLNLKEKGKKLDERKYYLNGNGNGIMVFFLIVFAFLWYAQLTKISDGLVAVTYNTIKNMGKIFTQEMKSEEVRSALFGGAGIYTIKDVQDYAYNTLLDYHTNKPYINYYSSEKYKDYKPEPIYPKYLPITNQIAQKTIYYSHEIAKKSIKVFIIVGVFYLLFTQFKKRKMDIEYILMILDCVFLVGVILFVPYISIAYNFERLYQQALVILSLPAVLGGLVLFRFFKKENIKIILMTIIFIWYFLPYSGFTSQLFGGEPQMNLNNFGEAHDRFYTHESEVKSLEWLSKYYNQKNEIYLDRYATLKAYYFFKINEKNILEDILPSTIDKNAYVYSSYVNTIYKRTFIYYGSKEMSYNFPTEFLNQNKNLIYNNGSSEVFK
jgi:uncharacterized membrane protein